MTTLENSSAVQAKILGISPLAVEVHNRLKRLGVPLQLIGDAMDTSGESYTRAEQAIIEWTKGRFDLTDEVSALSILNGECTPPQWSA